MLEARGLSKKFKDLTALNALNLRVEPGEVVCLLGANGAGKTTTINLFLGFLQPSQGLALVGGIEVKPDAGEFKKQVAYIPEQVALYPVLSGFENLKYFAALGGNDEYSAHDLYGFLQRVGLSRAFADKRVEGYSKGMRQKVGVAIALAKKAKAFLMDEPMSGLDPSAANEFSRLVEDLRKGGAAILMATHDIFRAKEMATNIGIMKAGKLVELLNPKDISAADLEQIYLRHMRAEEANSVPEDASVSRSGSSGLGGSSEEVGA